MSSSQHPSQSRHRNKHTRHVSELDVTRQASMADEGGASAALMDIEDAVERRLVGRALSRGSRRPQPRMAIALGLGAVSIALGAWAVYAHTSKRSRWSFSRWSL